MSAQLRKARNWPAVYQMNSKFKIYDGIIEVFDFLNAHRVPTAIVSTSPRPYCERVVNHIKMHCDHIVAYHDAQPTKPHPAPMLKALELLKLKPGQVISIGDRAIDIEASTAAGIEGSP